jgi:Xaa-Pro aminopeptidase
MPKLTRRRWIAATGAAAAAASVRSSSAAAAGPELPSLPPRPKPDVFRERQARLRASAKSRGWDALLVTPSTNLAYSTGLSMGRSERLTALLLFTDGPAVLVTPAFEESNVTRDATTDDVKTWQEDQDPIAIAAKLLPGKTVGVEGSTAYSTVSLISSAASAKTEDASPIFDALRSFGPPSDEVRKVYGIVDRAQVAGIEALEAGKTGEEVDRAARKVIEDAGYGAYFTHRLGHGLGMDGHEHPYLVKGNRKPLVSGNTVTIEPGVYLPGKFGVRIEDDYGVREKGLASLSVRALELVVLKG